MLYFCLYTLWTLVTFLLLKCTRGQKCMCIHNYSTLASKVARTRENTCTKRRDTCLRYSQVGNKVTPFFVLTLASLVVCVSLLCKYSHVYSTCVFFSLNFGRRFSCWEETFRFYKIKLYVIRMSFFFIKSMLD